MSEELRVIEFVPPGIEAIAAGLGYLDAERIALSVTRTRSALEQRDRMMAGERDVALTAIDNLIAWNARGDDLRLVAQVERTTVQDLIVSADVSAIGDLRGRTLAVDAVDSGFSIVLRKLLVDGGLEDGSGPLLGAGGIQQRFEALCDGRATAALLAPPWSYQAVEAGLRRLLRTHEVLPRLPGIGVVVRSARLAELDGPLTAYLNALTRAASWVATARREDALELLDTAGFRGPGATDILAVCPIDLTPSADGVELLFDMRRQLGMLPANAPTAQSLIAAWQPSAAAARSQIGSSPTR